MFTGMIDIYENSMYFEQLQTCFLSTILQTQKRDPIRDSFKEFLNVCWKFQFPSHSVNLPFRESILSTNFLFSDKRDNFIQLFSCYTKKIHIKYIYIIYIHQIYNTICAIVRFYVSVSIKFNTPYGVLVQTTFVLRLLEIIAQFVPIPYNFMKSWCRFVQKVEKNQIKIIILMVHNGYFAQQLHQFPHFQAIF